MLIAIIVLSIVVILFFLLIKTLLSKYAIEPQNADLANKSPAELRFTVESLRTDYKAAKDRIERLKDRIQKLEKEREEATKLTKKINSLAGEIATLQSQNQALHRQLDDAENVRKALIEELGGAFGQAEAEFIEFATWNVLVSKITQVIHEVKKAEDQIKSAVREVENLKQDKLNLSVNLAEKENELKRLQRKLETTEQELLNSQYVKSPVQEVENLKQDKLNLSVNLAEKENELKRLQRKLETTEQELLNSQHKERTLEITKNEVAIFEYTQDVLRDSRKEDTISETLDFAGKDIEILQRQIVELKEINQKLQEELFAVSSLLSTDDEIQSFVDYFEFQFEKICRKDDKQNFVEEFYEYTEHNFWHSNFTLSSLKRFT